MSLIGFGVILQNMKLKLKIWRMCICWSDNWSVNIQYMWLGCSLKCHIVPKWIVYNKAQTNYYVHFVFEPRYLCLLFYLCVCGFRVCMWTSVCMWIHGWVWCMRVKWMKNSLTWKHFQRYTNCKSNVTAKHECTHAKSI